MFDEKTYNQKMDKTIEVFSKELTSLRTGRANASMLDLVKVEVYGQEMPLNQVSSITTPDARTINIQVWDLNNVPLVDSAIKKSELGLNPQIDGQLIRLPIPDLNEERRNEIKKVIKSIGEKCKVSIRNIRREANDDLKNLVKNKEISEDDEKKKWKNCSKFYRQSYQRNRSKSWNQRKRNNDNMNPIKHVAIIMDGNGRWGIKNKGSRNWGHRAGLNTKESIDRKSVV